MDQNYDTLLEKAKAFHGDVCAGIVMGTRLTLAGMKALGLNPLERNRDLIVFVEIDRCMTDAVQAITGCSLGHRTLKFFNYGKFAATFYDMAKKRAVRVSRKNVEFDQENPMQSINAITDEDLMNIQEVSVSLESNDVPGRPLGMDHCSRCQEMILDNKGVEIEGKLLCRSCAGGPYYTNTEVGNKL
jgi:formylmethanofuran dehydrogenase subunit E